MTATSNSSLAVSYTTTSDKITINAATVTIVKAGRVSIAASQDGNDVYAGAALVQQSFCIKPLKPVITISGTNPVTVLTSSASAGNKWFLNGNVIPSATNTTFSATAPGIYQVQVTVDDCVSAFSADAPVIVTGDLTGYSNAVSVHPNPVENYLELSGIKGELSNVQLVDLAGRRKSIEFEKRGEIYQASVQHLAPGIYLLQIQQGSTLHRIKIIKK